MEFGGLAGVGDAHGRACMSTTPPPPNEEDMDLRRGPWTAEEDLILTNYITARGEGRWNSLAHCAGLKRTGKSCRLRWLNYLRPDVRRGNITPEEQLLILELHCRWGNRWSKIAQHLPGRTDNEIKNYWRTRVQKHAKQLKCDVNSKQFKDVMRYLWIPRLMERIRAANSGSGAAYGSIVVGQASGGDRTAAPAVSGSAQVEPSTESSGGPVSSFESSVGTHLSSPVTVTTGEDNLAGDGSRVGQSDTSEYWGNWTESLQSPGGYPNLGFPDLEWWPCGDLNENLWSLEDL